MEHYKFDTRVISVVDFRQDSAETYLYRMQEERTNQVYSNESTLLYTNLDTIL